MNFWARFMSSEKGRAFSRNVMLLGPLLALITLFILFSVLSSSFLTFDNLRNVLAQVSILAVMAVGLTLVLLLGEFDLSFANIAVLTGMAGAIFYSGTSFTVPLLGDTTFGEGSQLIAIVVPLLIAVGLGLISGLMSAKLGIPSLVGTLGIFLLAQGWAFFWAQGEIVYNVVPLTSTLGGKFAGPIPAIVISAGVILLATHFMLTRTRFGRYIYMTGANRAAAELSGIPTGRVVIIVFVLAGLLSGIAGMLNVGRLGAADATSGLNLLLPVIAAVVLGGTALTGGIGGMGNTFIGLLLWGVLDNGLDQIDIDPYAKPLASGLFLLGAIIFNVLGMKLAQRAREDEARIETEEAPDEGPPVAVQAPE